MLKDALLFFFQLQILLMDHCVLMEVISQRTRSFPSLPTGVPGPPTNLNIGMDYWSGHGNVSTTVPGVVVVDGFSITNMDTGFVSPPFLYRYSLSSVFDCFGK